MRHQTTAYAVNHSSWASWQHACAPSPLLSTVPMRKSTLSTLCIAFSLVLRWLGTPVAALIRYLRTPGKLQLAPCWRHTDI